MDYKLKYLYLGIVELSKEDNPVGFYFLRFTEEMIFEVYLDKSMTFNDVKAVVELWPAADALCRQQQEA